MLTDIAGRIVVSYRNSTSNHNFARSVITGSLLYLIEILHQTTTTPRWEMNLDWLYLIEILHQTTTFCHVRLIRTQLYLIEILHQTTTVQKLLRKQAGCILSKFYIKPQLIVRSVTGTYSCILSKFYIKPQLVLLRLDFLSVVSYRNSTSNHNWKSFIVCNLVLYLIEILHQTTTEREYDQALK